MFENFDPKLAQSLVQSCVFELEKDQFLFKKSETGKGIYLILEGLLGEEIKGQRFQRF